MFACSTTFCFVQWIICSCTIVPQPDASLIITPLGPHFIGECLLLECNATISPYVDTPFSVHFTWKKNGTVITNDSNLSITDSVLNPRIYQSTLKINQLSMNEKGAYYFCEVQAVPVQQEDDVNSQFIYPSTLARTQLYALEVLQGELNNTQVHSPNFVWHFRTDTPLCQVRFQVVLEPFMNFSNCSDSIKVDVLPYANIY